MNLKKQSILLIIPSFLAYLIGFKLSDNYFLPFVLGFTFLIITWLFIYLKNESRNFLNTIKSTVLPVIIVLSLFMLTKSVNEISKVEEAQFKHIDIELKFIDAVMLIICPMALLISFSLLGTFILIQKNEKKNSITVKSLDFNEYLFALTAYLTNIQENNIEDIIEYLKKYHESKNLKIDSAHIEDKLKHYQENKVDLQSTCKMILWLLPFNERKYLLFHLFGILTLESQILVTELENNLKYISKYTGINEKAYNYIKAFYVQENYFYNENETLLSADLQYETKLTNAFLILDIDPNASNEQIKKAYRNKVKEFHPDKVNYLGLEAINASQSIFLRIQNAYELICKDRKIN